jgi:hypothetical protein
MIMEKKNEWTIGREGEIVVAPDDMTVSRKHVKLIRDANEYYIEDLNSTGGTSVNGQRIKKMKVNMTDRVLIGNYSLDLKTIIDRLPMSDSDFSIAFNTLKDVYDTYVKTKVKLQSVSQSSMMIKRSLPMALPGVVIMIISLLSGSDAGARLVITIGGAVLSAIAIAVGTIWASKDTAKLPEKLVELDEQFKLDYSCPACHRPFGQVPWESLRRQGQCPHCRRNFNG